MNSHPDPRLSIGIIGGGFVGITLAGHLLQNLDLSVTILERDSAKVELFKLGNYQVFEPELNQILDDSRLDARLSFNDETFELLDCVFISVGTPKGMSSEEQLESFKQIVLSAETRIKERGFIYLRSTVSLGTTQKLADWITSTHRKDLSVYFAPERTAEGNAIQELRTLPQVVGGASQSRCEGFELLQILGFKTIICSSSKVAELVKLSCNTWRDTIFAFANELAGIADFEGVNVREVIDTANQDYIRGGIPKPGPVGGPCLSKDSHILLDNTPYALESMILAGRLVNERLIKKVSEYLISSALGCETFLVEILGAAFKGKPFTNDVRDGLADQIISTVLSQNEAGISFWITDSTLEVNDLLKLQEFWHAGIHPVSPKVVIIGHNGEWVTSPQIAEYLRSLRQDVTIIDLWGVTQNLSGIGADVKLLGSGYFL